jgi:hypothetical protein
MLLLYTSELLKLLKTKKGNPFKKGNRLFHMSADDSTSLT